MPTAMLTHPLNLGTTSAWCWLMAALRGEPPPDVSVDRRELAALLAQHHLHCHFNRWLSKFKGITAVDVLLDSQNKELHFWKRRNLSNLAVLTELQGTFSVLNISALILKGIGLSQRLYEDHTERVVNDVDILISPDQLPEAHAVLIKQGYQPTFDPKLLNLHQKNIRHIFKDLAYLHSALGLKLELHWRLEANEMLFNLHFTDLWAQRRMVIVGPLEIATLGDEHNILYLALHGTRHYWSRLQWLTDFSRLIEVSDLNWNSVLREAEKTDSLRSLLLGCVLREGLCAAPLPIPEPRQSIGNSLQAQVNYCSECLKHQGHPRSIQAIFSRLCFVLSLSSKMSYKLSVIKLLLSDGYETSLGERLPLSVGKMRYFVNPVYLMRRISRNIGWSS